MGNEELAARIKSGETDLMAQLWEQNGGLFRLKASGLYARYRERCISSGVTVDDIFQVGYFALADAVKAFDPAKGFKFMSYVSYPLLNHFKALVGLRTSKRDPLNNCMSLNRLVGDGLDTELEAMIPDPASGEAYADALDGVFFDGLNRDIEAALSKLPEKHAAAIRGRYFEGKQQQEIAADLGCGNKNVLYLQNMAIKKLRLDPALQAYADEMLSAWAYRGTGYRAFRRNMESSVETSVIKLDRLARRRRKPRFR